MKRIVIINKSDGTGGAAVVSYRLMQALRAVGVDARMLVVEKLSDSPYVELASTPAKMRLPFLAERLGIFVANGFNRSTLFKIDTGADGLPLWKHPLVKSADAIMLNWINQGMLSLDGVRKILRLGKPVLWTMHDMWNMTGICHHAGECDRFKGECRECPLLGKGALEKSLARKIWSRKKLLYSGPEKIRFVAVSSWLRDKASCSSLLWRQNVSVIPNAFPVDAIPQREVRGDEDPIRIGFGAYRLDDPIKGLLVMAEMTRILRDEHPDLAGRLEIVTFGAVKNPEALNGIKLRHKHLGVLKGESAIRKAYEDTDITLSASSYETLPGTLVEAQAYGCVPVSFNRGGQSDIVSHLSTGYIAEYSEEISVAARNLAEGVRWAAGIVADTSKLSEIQREMRRNVERKFSAPAVARAYLDLLGF